MPTKKTIDEIIPEEEAVGSGYVNNEEDAVNHSEEQSPEKPKRARKKKSESELAEEQSDNETVVNQAEISAERTVNKSNDYADKILTIDAKAEISTEEIKSDAIWHEIQNAFRTKRMLTGILSGIEQNELSQHYAVADYKGFRIVIPLKEMFSEFPNDLHGDEYKSVVNRYNRLMNSMLGAEIDFIVKGTDTKARSVVASRKEAMLKKRQIFYMETDENGMFRIYEDRIVQARVIAVAEKAIRIEVFGVDCAVPVKFLSWDWIGDARERFSVGDEILVRMKEIDRSDSKKLSVMADARSVGENRNANLELCKLQGKYAGRVTDIHKGVVFIRLNNGANAIAHTCLDRRNPGKKDDVSFAVTALDEERGVALGIITRIIKQNL